jgi:hypothetical protein
MRALSSRKFWLLGLAVAATGVLMIGPAGAFASGNAVYTSTDATQGGCLNASPTNDKNCNIYESKEDVYLSGGPTNGPGLGEGDYFFAILAPGGQADPTDGAPNNLSNSDAYAARKFHVNADGSLTNGGTHADGTDVDGRAVIQAMPYDDTPNPGGVYILAVCKWLGDEEGANDATVPSKCKYDAFKIKASEDNGGAADDPVVTKDAKATFKRTFPWDIDKSVECAGGSPYGTYDQLVQKVSGTVKCDYTIDVTKGEGVDSAWLVKGTISVFNPNDDGSVTLDDVTDDIGDPNGTCSVDTATNGLVVPAAGTVEYTYECTFDDPPDPPGGTNTASASWSEQTVGGATLAANGGTGTAAFTFDDGTEDNPKKIDDCTDVSDVLDGTSVPLSPDQVCETTQITATAYFDVPQSGCVDHSNTATETPVDEGDAESDSTSVRICGPVGGEGTMGFWQNKNGQALIKAGTSTAGVCNSGTYLRTYAPFQDLSATATCNQVATYVTNIIKAANASGASMNAMLKAQMLSTALDVSFNKVPSNVLMDLTKVNKPIGSANYENVTAAFGGASSLTVSQMLTYAASQSNVGGSVWYGQVKATQGLAKDAFDAINNGVALSI